MEVIFQYRTFVLSKKGVPGEGRHLESVVAGEPIVTTVADSSESARQSPSVSSGYGSDRGA